MEKGAGERDGTSSNRTSASTSIANQIKSNMTLIMVDKPQPSYNLLTVMK